MTKEKIDLWIIAAGRGTRMGNISIPKALVKINGKSNLQNTLDIVDDIFKNIFVVIASDVKDVVIETIDSWYNDHNIITVPVECGGGDGKAILEAYETIKAGVNDVEVSSQCIILWGDAHISSRNIIDELISIMHNESVSAVIPVKLENRPYVSINASSITINGRMIAMSADFTRYGEVRDVGYHDQSIFGVDLNKLIPALGIMRDSNKKIDDCGNIKYTTQSGELTFLNVIHYLYNIKNPAILYETEYPLLGYNTIEELKVIEEKMKGLI